MKIKRSYILLVLLASFSACNAPTEFIRWTYPTGDRIYGHPMINQGQLFIGSTDEFFYCLDVVSGELIWKYEAAGAIRTSSIVDGEHLFFMGGNTCYSLNRSTGEENWVYSTGEQEGEEKLDPWDYHSATPVVDDSLVYYASTHGRIYGLDKDDGEMSVLIEAIDSAAIRSTPVIENGTLYFGDWNGLIYAYSIPERKLLWTKRTYDTQPYATFGMVNTELIIYDSLLIFGARNPEIQVVSKFTGEVVWSYKENEGGWISGDPVVHNDTLYIGGSDSHRLNAFNVYTGELYWDYVFLYNNFSKPVVVSEFIVFTTGNAYAYQGENTGSGYLYALNRRDGSLYNFEKIGGNLFTTPLIQEDAIIVGSCDGGIYTIDSELFFKDPVGMLEKGYRSVRINDLNPNPFNDTIHINYTVEYTSEVFLKVKSFDGTEITTLLTSTQTKGDHVFVWDGYDANGDAVPPGYLLLELGSAQYCLTEIMLKK